MKIKQIIRNIEGLLDYWFMENVGRGGGEVAKVVEGRWTGGERWELGKEWFVKYLFLDVRVWSDCFFAKVGHDSDVSVLRTSTK